MTEPKKHEWLRGLANWAGFGSGRKRKSEPKPQEPEQQMTLTDLIDACIKLVRDGKDVYVKPNRGVVKNGFEIFEFLSFDKNGAKSYQLSMRGGGDVYNIEPQDGIYVCDGEIVDVKKLEELEQIYTEGQEKYKVYEQEWDKRQQSEAMRANVNLIKSYM